MLSRIAGITRVVGRRMPQQTRAMGAGPTKKRSSGHKPQHLSQAPRFEPLEDYSSLDLKVGTAMDTCEGRHAHHHASCRYAPFSPPSPSLISLPISLMNSTPWTPRSNSWWRRVAGHRRPRPGQTCPLPWIVQAWDKGCPCTLTTRQGAPRSSLSRARCVETCCCSRRSCRRL